MSRDRLRAGLGWGAAMVLPLAAGVSIAVALPATQKYFHDQAVSDLTLTQAFYRSSYASRWGRRWPRRCCFGVRFWGCSWATTSRERPSRSRLSRSACGTFSPPAQYGEQRGGRAGSGEHSVEDRCRRGHGCGHDRRRSGSLLAASQEREPAGSVDGPHRYQHAGHGRAFVGRACGAEARVAKAAWQTKGPRRSGTRPVWPVVGLLP